MKTKKTVITVLTVTLLITAALIVGCMDQLEGIPGKDAEDNYPIPEGKGVVKLKISDKVARTIMPNTSIPAVGDMYYKIIFTAQNSAPNSLTIGGTTAVALTAATTLIALNPDTYTVNIIAYDSAAQTNAIAGWDNSLHATYSAGVPVTTSSVLINANLIATVGGADGIFDFSIDVPAAVGGSYSTCTMSVVGYTSGLDVAASPYTIIPGTTLSGTPSIVSGYYLVTVEVAQDDHITRKHTQVLHIYPTMTSTYSLNVDPLVKNVFDIGFNLNGETPTAGPYDGSLQHVPYGSPIADPGTPLAASGKTFVGWYTETGTTTAWPLTKAVTGDQTLWAKWDEAGITFTITFTFAEAGAFTVPTHSINRGSFDGSNEVKLVLDTSDGALWTDIKWEVSDITDLIIANHLSDTSVTDDSLTIDNSGDFSALLAADLTVTVRAKRNGIPYSAEATITVNN